MLLLLVLRLLLLVQFLPLLLSLLPLLPLLILLLLLLLLSVGTEATTTTNTTGSCFGEISVSVSRGPQVVLIDFLSVSWFFWEITAGVSQPWERPWSLSSLLYIASNCLWEKTNKIRFLRPSISLSLCFTYKVTEQVLAKFGIDVPHWNISEIFHFVIMILHLAPRSKMEALYFRSPIRLHGAVLN
jgi:hypothetical protein